MWRMETFDALRERVLDRFEALGPIELKGVADPVPLFRAASWRRGPSRRLSCATCPLARR
jgi:class 3 adenylate cyclase